MTAGVGDDVEFQILTACIIALGLVPLLVHYLNPLAVTAFNLLIAGYTFYRLYHLRETSNLLASKIKEDSLTGLPNRDSFYRLLGSMIPDPEDEQQENSPKVAVLLLDLNGFKKINDTLGHLTGDVLLELVAKRLTSLLRANDVVARLGGDEFGILLDLEHLSTDYTIICDRIVKAFTDQFQLSTDVNTTVGISVGVALYPEHGNTVPDLIRCADIAMYVAKRNKLGYCLYTKDQDTTSNESLLLSSGLKSALASDEFVFYFQPQMDLKTGKICGVEALLRWPHPVLGLVSPDKFIPIFEQSNLISNLTVWSLQTGIRKLAKFREVCPDLTLAINISPHSILNSDILVNIAREMVYNSVPTSNLILEITETTISHSPEELAKVIACVDMLGVHISIDDFGTGQSSLMYLKHLPIKEIKIDRAFVSKMMQGGADEIIVESTINLGHSLNCTVVAEGVETEEIKQRLIDLGCDVIQGYYLSKPLQEDELIKFLKEHQ